MQFQNRDICKREILWSYRKLAAELNKNHDVMWKMADSLVSFPSQLESAVCNTVKQKSNCFSENLLDVLNLKVKDENYILYERYD